MNTGQACRPCRGSCSLISGRGCFDDPPGDEIVVSPPSPIVEPLADVRIMQEGVFITPQEAMEPVLNETLIYHESKSSPKALKSSLAFHNS